MSTRSVIARKTSTGFCGVYHHWDGYPRGLGAFLFQYLGGHLKRQVEDALKRMIDESPGGWSSLMQLAPKAYDDPDRAPVTEENASAVGCEFAYVFPSDHSTMEIWSSFCGEGERKGQKMIGAFGAGDKDATWKCVATVDLSKDEPNWEEIENGNL